MRCLGAGFALFIAVSAAAGCSGDDNTGGSGGSGSQDAAGGDGNFVACAAPGDPVDTYHANLTKPGDRGLLTFMLVQSDNAPPLQGVNTWQLKITKADQTPVTGEVVGDAKMPRHIHPAQDQPVTTYDPGLGLYVATPLYFFMPGYWAAHFKVYETTSDAGDPVDTGTFYFCIE